MLWQFCNASLRAYAAVTYLVIESKTGPHVEFTASKTRVSPLKQQTIARLEMLSALLFARLIASVTETLWNELPVSLYSCFIESMVALHWYLESTEAGSRLCQTECLRFEGCFHWNIGHIVQEETTLQISLPEAS